jgi:inner membrane protein
MDIISHALLPYLLGRFLRMDRKMLAAFVIGSVAPDLDVFILWLAQIFPSPDLLLVHRGITHSLIFGSLMALSVLLLISRPPGRDIFRRWTAVELWLSWPVLAAALAGVLLHLFLDYLITKGVPLIYPLSTTRFSAEFLFHYEITILLFSAGAALWILRNFHAGKPISQKANNRLLALFLVVLLMTGGLRVEGKERAIYQEDSRLAEGPAEDFEVFPDWGLFQWNILEGNESSFQVYSYDSLNNRTLYLDSYPKLHVEMEDDDPGPTTDLKDALSLADSLPRVVLFRWRACAVAVNVSQNNRTWNIEYYDPVGRAGMVKAPVWMRERFERSSSLKVRVDDDQAYLMTW